MIITTEEKTVGELAGRDWQTANLDDLIDYILTRHHAYLKSELPRLARLLGNVAKSHPQHAPTLASLGQTYSDLQQELESHLMKEEMVLFPMIRMGRAGIAGPVSVMEHEHECAGRALARMRTITSDYTVPPDACQAYQVLFEGLRELEADLRQHIHLENDILFPRAAAATS